MLSTAEFSHSNRKNTRIRYTLFKLNCGFYLRALYKKNVNFWSKSNAGDKFVRKLWQLVTISQKNLLYEYELQKKFHDKSTKQKSYVLGEKVQLHSKYIVTKWNKKLEAGFYESFRILYLVGQVTYKLKLSQNWKIYNVFYISLVE